MNEGVSDMDKKIKISIITATYNSAKTIRQTIESVLQQDYSDIEYIIIDGKSTDDTLKIVKEYGDNIKWVSEPDKGIYDALNKGVKIATGDYIEIIGSDDALADEGVISRIVKQIDLTTDIISGQELGVDEQSKVTRIYCDNCLARDKNKYQGGMIGHGAMFVRKDLMMKYPFDISYKIAADYKFFLQCYYDDIVNIKFVDDVVLFFSMSGVSSDLKKCALEDNRIYKELGLPFFSPQLYSESMLKKMIKVFLWNVHLFYLLLDIKMKVEMLLYNKLFGEKHFCKNKVCRWCGRV